MPEAPQTGLEGEYEILNELYSSEGAPTYLGRNKQLLRDVTISVVPAAARGGAGALMRIASDARLLVTIRHANVIPVIEGRWRGRNAYVIVRAKVRGSTLEQLIKEAGPLPLLRVRTTLEQVQTALEWARSNGVAFRRVPPESLTFQQGSGRVLVAFDSPPTGAPKPPAGAKPFYEDIRTIGRLARVMLSGRIDAGSDTTPLSQLRPDLAPRVSVNADGLADGELTEESDVTKFLSLLTATVGISTADLPPLPKERLSPPQPMITPSSTPVNTPEQDLEAHTGPRVTAPRKKIDLGPSPIAADEASVAEKKPALGDAELVPEKPAAHDEDEEEKPKQPSAPDAALVVDAQIEPVVFGRKTPATATPAIELTPAPEPPPEEPLELLPAPPPTPPPSFSRTAARAAFVPPKPPAADTPTAPPPRTPASTPEAGVPRTDEFEIVAETPAPAPKPPVSATPPRPPATPPAPPTPPPQPAAPPSLELLPAQPGMEPVSPESPPPAMPMFRGSLILDAPFGSPEVPTSAPDTAPIARSTPAAPRGQTPREPPHAARLTPPASRHGTPVIPPLDMPLHAPPPTGSPSPPQGSQSPPPLRSTPPARPSTPVYAVPSTPTPSSSTPVVPPPSEPPYESRYPTPPSTRIVTPSSNRPVAPTPPRPRQSTEKQAVAEPAEIEPPHTRETRIPPKRRRRMNTRLIGAGVAIIVLAVAGVASVSTIKRRNAAADSAAAAAPKPDTTTPVVDAGKTKGKKATVPAAAQGSPAATTPAVAAKTDAPKPPSTGPCASAVVADQERCFTETVQKDDDDLNTTFVALIAALRREAKVDPGKPDPKTAEALRNEQDAWENRRTRSCPDNRVGTYWGRDRAACFLEFSSKRKQDLQQKLAKIPEGG